MVRRASSQEFTNEPRLLVCQQKVPAPSKVNGAAIVAVTGLQVPPPGVGVRVGVLVGVPGAGVRVGVAEGPVVGVLVRVGVRVAVGCGLPESCALRAGYHLSDIFWLPESFGCTPSVV